MKIKNIERQNKRRKGSLPFQFPLLVILSFLHCNIVMATTRKVAKIAEGRNRSLEQPTKKKVINDLLQKCLSNWPLSKLKHLY